MREMDSEVSQKEPAKKKRRIEPGTQIQVNIRVDLGNFLGYEDFAYQEMGDIPNPGDNDVNEQFENLFNEELLDT